MNWGPLVTRNISILNSLTWDLQINITVNRDAHKMLKQRITKSPHYK